MSVLVALAAVAAFAQPRIDSVSPSEVPIAGGTVVTVRGANFGGAGVTLDRTAIAPLSRSATQIELVLPPRYNGYATIAVTGQGTSAYAEVLYVAPPLHELPAGHITTVAGVGIFSGDYRPATLAVVSPWGVAFDWSGNTYIAEAANDRVVRIGANGVLEPFAGNGRIDGPRPEGPAPALEVPISYPRGIAVDATGNLYVPDTTYRLWRVSPGGIAEIIAGSGKEEHSGDGGPARFASIGHPSYIALDGQGNLYFIDATFMRIRRIDAQGTITTVAGDGTAGFSGDGGLATAARFDIGFADMGGLASDPAGNLFLLDYANRRIRRIDRASGIISTIVDSTLAGSSLADMRGIALDGEGNLYFSHASEIFRRSAAGTITRVTTGRGGFSPDGTPLTEAKLGGSILAISPSGELVISEAARVRRVGVDGRLQTIAGIGPERYDEGRSAAGALLTSPNLDLAIAPTGQLVYGDVDRIRRIGHDGKVVTIAGTGTAGPIEGVPALEANVAASSIHISADGSIDFAGGALGTSRLGSDQIVRKTSGRFTPCGFSGDGGSALDAEFCQVWDAVRDSNGDLLIADTNNNRIRRVDKTSGVVSTIAGSGPSNGLEKYGAGMNCGDGGAATAACMNTPYGIAVDGEGNLYVSNVDTPGRIRRVSASGTILTFAEVTATKLLWWRHHLFAVSSERVLRFSRDGEVTVLAGNGEPGFSGDGGPALAATMVARKQSHGVAVDEEGNLYFSDGDNRRIRAVRYGAVLPPPGASIEMTGGASGIRVVVRDSVGRSAPSVRVDFTAAGSGASCFLSRPFVLTDGAGIAEVSCTSNCVAGSYTVTARPLTGTASGAVTLTNPSTRCRRRAARQ